MRSSGAVRKGELPASIDQDALALFLVSQMYGLVVLSKGGAPAATLERVIATALSVARRVSSFFLSCF